MTDLDIPADLVRLQRAFLDLDARCEEIGRGFPQAVDIAAGLTEPQAEHVAALAEARAERLEAAVLLGQHQWWATIVPGGRHDAKVALLWEARAGSAT
ncbi:hypothetical protein [Thermomonospora umbrina]|uniref:Uncharacterized protein n=1 Tax=Thermomonospora umbrina TaxID=111806 RepID=A0A3D9SWJ5_9ACTN|nr:hypothetical protein [Thermomonospora umbrina]REF00307.1 hypothetical protein DFJ69_5838 [Thermomonospora umbrina]